MDYDDFFASINFSDPIMHDGISDFGVDLGLQTVEVTNDRLEFWIGKIFRKLNSCVEVAGSFSKESLTTALTVSLFCNYT